MTLAAGAYQGQLGTRVYAHDTGGAMSGRAVVHAIQGRTLAGLGMHMGGVRTGTALGAVESWTASGRPPAVPPELLTRDHHLMGHNRGRAFRLGAYEQWGQLGPAGDPAQSLNITNGLGTLGDYTMWTPMRQSAMPLPVGGRGVTLGKVVLGALGVAALAALA